MNFITSFHESVSQQKMVAFDIQPDILIPNLYECSTPLPSSFLTLLGGGTSLAEYPFSFSFSPLHYSLLLYTLSGSCQLSQNGHTYTVASHTGFLYDCSEPFTLHTTVLPWKFKSFFLAGTDLDAFHSLTQNPLPPFEVADHSSLHHYFSKLSGIPNQYSINDALHVHKTLTDILCELYDHAIGTLSSNLNELLPTYLVELKNQLDQNYQLNFNLSDMEDTLKVGKYRLCRDFSKTYGMPPLRYLNQKRIEIAKEMLLTTDYNIHEISSMIGYENINHFINLFKKSTGLTPNAFKQMAQASQSASHFPSL